MNSDNLNGTIFFLGLALACAGDVGRAADIAFDSAGDSTYSTGWINGSNGGYGWGGGWQMHAWNADFQAFLGDSSTNGHGDPEGDGDINSPRAASGRAWGIIEGYATRPFNGPLSSGQTFSIDLDDYAADQYGCEVYLSLLAPDGSDALTLDADQFGGDGAYDLVYSTGVSSSSALHFGVPLTDKGIHLAFTQLNSGFEVSLTPYIAGATTTTLEVPYTGQVSAVQFTTFGFPDTALDSYINNIAITPEPSSTAVMGLAAFALLARPRPRVGVE